MGSIKKSSIRGRQEAGGGKREAKEEGGKRKEERGKGKNEGKPVKEERGKGKNEGKPVKEERGKGKNEEKPVGARFIAPDQTKTTKQSFPPLPLRPSAPLPSISALRRLILARQGLLRWSGGNGGYTEGVPWREELKGSEGALEVLRRLEAIQLDPVNVVAPNHHLVLANRVGGYQGEHLEALYPAKQVFEYWAQARCILPIEHYGHFASRRKVWAGLSENFDSRSDPELMKKAVAHIRQRLKKEGTLPLRAFESERTPGFWGFSGKATSHAMEHLFFAGEVAVAQRNGDERHFALSKQHFADLPKDEKSLEALWLKFVRAYGVFDASDPRLGWRSWGDAASVRKQALAHWLQNGTVVPLALPFKRKYYVWSELLPLLESLEKAKVAPEVFFLAPLDNFMWRRERIVDLFGFDYKWEIYVPDPKRKYGPYVLPVVEGEELIARVDVRSSRADGTLVLKQIWWEQSANAAREKRVKKALGQFASGLGLEFANAKDLGT